MRTVHENKIDFDEESNNPPHGEEQSIVDHLERPVYDGDFDDYDDDWIDDGS